MSDLMSPEGVVMLALAVMLDIIGIICLILDLVFGIGEVLSYIPDFIGIGFFGLWILMRSQEEKTYKQARGEVASAVAEHKRKVQAAKKAFKKGAKRAGKRGFKFLFAMVGELIPLLGALPFWTIFVLLELRGDK
ncbi:hypothetical protein KAW43_02760 [Candidatus Parcubacteria bacterium]|nr:hypothetical protein [Candidatus Parcubacteria bacterium]